jgi:3-keto-5-aminohexanoate cleavage enzyme
VGLEDSIYYQYQNKELATNTKLVKRIVNLAHELGRKIATPKEARKILRITK